MGGLKIAITGNRNKDLCKPLVEKLESLGHECRCFSRESGYDFSNEPYAVIGDLVKEIEPADIFINLHAVYFFNQTLLAHKVYQNWADKGLNNKWMINVGSTTDRVKRGKTNLYHYEKLALRDFSAGLSMCGVWGEAPRVSHISVGTLSNRQDKHPDRKTLDVETAAEYIVWILQQPKNLHVNELSIDPVQRA